MLSKSQQEIIKQIHGIKGHIVPVGINSTFKNMHIRNRIHLFKFQQSFEKPEGGFSWHRNQDYLISQLVMVKTIHPDVIINLISPPDEYYNSPTLQGIKGTHKFSGLHQQMT